MEKIPGRAYNHITPVSSRAISKFQTCSELNFLCLPSSGLLQASEPEWGRCLVRGSSPPTLLPLWLRADLSTPCQGEKRIRGKGKPSCMPAAVIWHQSPLGMEILQGCLFFSSLFLRSAPFSLHRLTVSSLMQTTCLWLSVSNNSLKLGLLVVPSPTAGQRGKIPLQMMPAQCFLWIPLCSLGPTPLCLL